MSRIKCLLCLLFCIFLLTACAAQEKPPVEEFPTAPEASYKTTTVERGEFTVKEQCAGSLIYPEFDTLCCEYPDAILAEDIRFGLGDEIKAGDVIATFKFNVSEAERKKLELSYQEAVRVMQEQTEQFQNKIAQYDELINAGGISGEIARLQKEQTENELKLYLADTEKEVLQKRESMEEYQGRFSEKTLIAPESGIVSWKESCTAGTTLRDGAPLLSYYTDGIKFLVANNPSAELLKLAAPGMKVLIGDNNTTVEGYIVATPAGIDDLAGSKELYVTSEHFDELNKRSSYSIECTVLHLDDVLLLDQKAIRNDGTTDYVLIVQNGTTMRRNVLCGLKGDGKICILAGLEEGQQVIIN